MPVIELDGSSQGATGDGLLIVASDSAVRGLAINSFPAHGIVLRDGGGNLIEGNYIGVGTDGVTDRGNAVNGVNIVDSAANTIGGTTALARNVISGNNANGVFIGGKTATGNVVQGNYIGLDAGEASLGNTLSGVRIQAAPGNTIGASNAISGNGEHGVLIYGGGSQNNRVASNYIFTNAGDGVHLERSRNNTVGGTTAGEGNQISGNSQSGVSIGHISSFGNLVQGNFIFDNEQHGVSISQSPNNTVGGTTEGAGNLISDNVRSGVFIGNTTATGNLVQGNVIGGQFFLPVLGNGESGVHVQSAPGNTIGGTAMGAGNVITQNDFRGVLVRGSAATGNLISRNAISLNVGRGIDLNGDGVTANDADDPDAGPNNLQNFPVITSAVLNGGNLDVTYSVPSRRNLPLRREAFS